ncbi:patatin-like phospholipase domain-containing protein 2 [Lates japonicus]|uniref:Patatin-like phospholipase domain-containing protein 2 n=1 Tax=Lates japonicus TaxID=270547 RepID=A0AAD3MPR0_LATJO|nr:patatin-like phospholipase domain-containing protein 2 [Lates japonicus]
MFPLDSPWNISFAGCGFLGIYHVGVASCLLEQAPFLVQNARHIYGASAGALTATALVSGVCLGEAGASIIDVAKEARKRFLGPMHPSFNLVKIVRHMLRRTLPADCHHQANGRLGISLTRVTDGENVLVTHYNNKEEVVQACVCSAYIPVYCGLIPPTLQGVIMKAMCKQGYKDALLFLKRNGLLNFNGPLKDRPLLANGEENEDYNDNEAEEENKSDEEEEKPQMEEKAVMVHSSSSIEEHIVEHLPPTLHKALVEACMERRSLAQSLGNLLPVRMASAMMLPYTFPLESAMSLTLRLLEWLPDVQEDVGWIREQVLKILQHVLRQASKSISQHVSARFSCQLELHHYQSLPSQFSSTSLFPTWVNERSSSVQDVFMRLNQYKRHLLSGVLCINMDLQGSFETGPMSSNKSSSSILSEDGLTMHAGCLNIPDAANSEDTISS